ncbi:uncharacterized protein LOC141649011 [Silene latifolia]|uniref:uncharacterized protein LOC141649011 n=1 Tax=Silene latifolia TaxID=37657 RepID=UPI003D76ECA3
MHDNSGDKRNKRGRRCCYIIISVIILIIILLAVLGATVFRAKRPTTTVNSVTLRNLDVSFDALQLNVHINVSLFANISVKNPNIVGIKYTDSSAFLDYRGQVVGQAPIPAGHISAGQTAILNLTLTVMADRFLSNSKEVISDVLSGSIPLSTRTRIQGKVTVFLFKIHVVSDANCNLNVSVATKSLSSNDCGEKQLANVSGLNFTCRCDYYRKAS